MVEKEECFKQLREVIDAVLSTVDKNGNPQSRIIDIMHIEDDKIYFLTGRGKHVYEEITNHPQVSYLSLKDNKSIRITGEARKLEDQKHWIDLIFDENPFMNNVYPGDARYILEPFCIENYQMEFFDLTQKPIYRHTFKFGDWEIIPKGFEITDVCVSCGTCLEVCPQKIPFYNDEHFEIPQQHCLHCGLCYENCPNDAIVRIE
ncbi:MAG: pyridoxamine 5'-phosphate oxidase family protein [Methanobrevibacter sp.]|nr:pyridoxamine 5'-phosphate oxidase family protein [Methanobrevibacter sp.]